MTTSPLPCHRPGPLAHPAPSRRGLPVVFAIVGALGVLAASDCTAQPPIRLAQASMAAGSSADIEFWRSVENSKQVDAYRAYLKTFPNGAFAELARLRIRQYGGGNGAAAGASAPPGPAPSASTADGAAPAVQIADDADVVPFRKLRYRYQDPLGRERTRDFQLSLSRQAAGKLEFNAGARIETELGRMLSASPALALGSFDALEPKQGWLRETMKVGDRWPLKYRSRDGRYSLDLVGEVTNRDTIKLGSSTLPGIWVCWQGEIADASDESNSAGIKIDLFYAPEVRRVVQGIAVATPRSNVGSIRIEERFDLLALE
ncbi:MAG: hypothetical protein R3E48_22465 [Burkholderiaceae bacterium]